MVVGIDLGGMSAKAACLSGAELTEKARTETSASNSPEETAFALAQLSMRAAELAGVPFEEVEAIGIGSPGIIDGAAGTVVRWYNFGWKDVPLAKLVSEHTKRPVFVLNDANAAALGEARYGAGKAYRDCALLTIGTGIGSGIILDGKLFEGFKSAGTEFGHTVIRQNGERCSCGRKGCYEMYASATALIRLTKEEMTRSRTSLMWRFAKSLDEVDGRTAFCAAAEGDAPAKLVLSEFISALGDGIVNLVNLLRPQAVLIGGGVSAAGDDLIKPLREYVYPRLFVSEEYAPFDLIRASLGNDAGLFGAAAYARERLH